MRGIQWCPIPSLLHRPRDTPPRRLVRRGEFVVISPRRPPPGGRPSASPSRRRRDARRWAETINRVWLPPRFQATCARSGDRAVPLRRAHSRRECSSVTLFCFRQDRDDRAGRLGTVRHVSTWDFSCRYMQTSSVLFWRHWYYTAQYWKMRWRFGACYRLIGANF